MKTYFVYILTNKNKTVLYVGVTNDLVRRLEEHVNHKNHINAFTYRYKCYYLLYYEEHRDINQAISREKQIKGWKRIKKENLISEFNPDWNFLNDLIF
ncbi:MAG: putative endonuclease [Anaerophaga sp.]|nr:putative endonuclease [Anaerophaga sp.]